MKYSVFIDGQSGTTGLQIVQRLAGHPDVTLLPITPEQRRDPRARAERMNSADLVFLCLPDDAAREAVALVTNPHTRIIDASTAHRVAPGWVYGLPELSPAQRRAVTEAKRVANPGCHATGFLLGLSPLVRAGIVPADYPVSSFSVTGYSGGGKSMIADYENPNRPDYFSGTRPYSLSLKHKHLPEMTAHAGLKSPPVFVPILGDFSQGMLVSLPLHASLLPAGTDARKVWDCLSRAYEGCRYVQVMPPDGADALQAGCLNPQALNGTNLAQIFVFSGEDRILVTTRLDNLGKGASGAAVQNMNLMLGLEESAGLEAL